MKKLGFLFSLVFCALFFTSNTFAQCQGNVYTTSLSLQSGNSVQGFTSTELDYCAGLYYDPANSGTFTEGYGTGNAILRTGYTEGYGDSVPAELNFISLAPISNATYTTSGNHFVIAYYQVYVPVYYGYYWYDPFGFGFESGGGTEQPYYSPDDYGWWGYATYWQSTPQFVGNTSHTISYAGQTFCLPGQQFTSAGQPCSSLPGCESGLQFSATGDVCPNFVPPVEGPDARRLVVAFDDNVILPSGIGKRSPTRTKVRTCVLGVSGAKSGYAVRLEKSDVSTDTGHVEDLHTGKRPLGSFGSSQGVTDATGCFVTSYHATFIAAAIKVTASAAGFEPGTATISIRVGNLARLPRGINYRLNGSGNPNECDAPQCTTAYMSDKGRRAHPFNHFVVSAAIPALAMIADSYKQKFYGNGYIPPDEMITYNDASLKWGGKFDGKLNWLNGSWHTFHRDGKNIDTKSQNIPPTRVDDLEAITNENGFGILHHTKKDRHFHFKWGDLNNSSTLSTLPPGGIDPNMSTFYEVSITLADLATNAAETIFHRPIVEEEFESWVPKLSTAKTQGDPALLQEVKTFYQQLFASQEYVIRQRTDAEFVEDVFGSHLLREPTESELAYWINYLSNIGGNDDPVSPEIAPTDGGKVRVGVPTLSQSQRRQMFLKYFETLPLFIGTIGGVIDESYSVPGN